MGETRSKSVWPEVTHGQPCPVCGREKWCRVSPEGDLVACRKVELGAIRNKTDRSGVPFYLHRVGPDRATPREPLPRQEQDRASPELLARIYQRLLECLTLNARHRRELQARGLTDQQIDRAGYRTLHLDRRDLVERLQQECPAQMLLSVPGFFVRGDQLMLAGKPGLLIPARDLDGNILAITVRPDEPGEGGKYRWLSSRPMGGAGPGAPAHIPVRTPRQADEVRLVEGVLKADVARALDPSTVSIGIPGAGPWKKALPVLQSLGCKVVRLAFDADSETNEHVGQALKAAVEGLRKEGYQVMLEQWDGERAKGIDDALKAGIDVRAVEPGGGVPPSADGDLPPRGQVEATADDRPVIVVSTEELQVTLAATEALTRSPSVYVRGTALVRVGVETRPPGQQGKTRRAPGTPVILEVQTATLSGYLSEVARWLKVDRRSGELVPAHPPGWCVRAVAEKAEYPGLRYLAGVADTPTLRPDGTVCETPGYDQETGLLYTPATTYPPVPARPTHADAKTAAEMLLDLVADFPFVGPEHRAAWLAAVLTVLARPAIAGPCPAFLVEASTAGSGKTLLARLVGIIATGRDLPATELATDSEEIRKTVFASALAGDRVILLDNAHAVFGSPAIDAALTANEITGRVLGESRTATVPLNAVWLVTGNNLHLRGDTHRRVIPCRLEPPCERPEERTGFRVSDLPSHAQERFADLLTAGLTILRAHAVAGRPATDLPHFGTFEAWDRVVRQAIHWATDLDCCATRAAIAPESRGGANSLEAFLAALAAVPGGNRAPGLTARAVLDRAKSGQHPDLLEVLGEWAREGKDLPDTNGLGYRLRGGRGRVAGSWRLQCGEGDGHRKVASWWAQAIQPAAGDAGDAGDLFPPYARESAVKQDVSCSAWREGSPASPAIPRKEGWGEDVQTPFD